MALFALSYVDLSRDLLVNLVCGPTLNMSRGLIEKDIEATAILVADGKDHYLRHLSVTRGESVQSLRLTVEPINPVPATAQKLILSIPDRGIHMTVLREECKGSLVPTDAHFHLIVPDRNNLEKIATLLLPDAPHLK